MAGLLTSRVDARPILHEQLLSGDHRGRSPLTVAGAVTGLARFGSSSPYSLFIPDAFSAFREPSPSIFAIPQGGSSGKLTDWGVTSGNS